MANVVTMEPLERLRLVIRQGQAAVDAGGYFVPLWLDPEMLGVLGRLIEGGVTNMDEPGELVESSLGFHLEDHPNIAGLRMVVYDGGRCAMPAGPVEVALWDEIQRLRNMLAEEPEGQSAPLKIGKWVMECTDGTRLQGSSGELRA